MTYRRVAITVLLGAALIASACGGGGSSSPNHVAVSADSKFVIEFADQNSAARKASEMSGFEVLTVEGMPAGFKLTGINVLAGEGRLTRVQLLISSPRGGLMIEQFPAPAITDVGSPWEVSGRGQYFRDTASDSHSYAVVENDRTFVILARTPDAITDAEARRILTEFATRA